jgi:two-component system, sensor histidine kinase RegB
MASARITEVRALQGMGGAEFFAQAFRGPAAEAATPSFSDATGSKNMLQLVQLRWIAVVGQVVTIGFVQFGLGVALPLRQMAIVVAILFGLNALSLLRLRLRLRGNVRNAELFLVLAFDVAALTAQLYLSGGVTNPFISLYLLQITLAAVLLEVRWAWAMVAITGVCFVSLTAFYQPLVLPVSLHLDPFKLHRQGILICFILDAMLLVLFVTRITGNLRERDAHLARMRQQAAEEEHVVRMGLLASGAAHELGTPLSTVSVILGDWQRMPALHAIPDLAQEIDEMQLAVHRCKSIISGILLSAGEARGEAPAVTTVGTFLDEFVQEWNASRPGSGLTFENNFGEDVPIVADLALKQVLSNLLVNAHETPSPRIRLSARRSVGNLVLAVSDDGPGFAPEMLAHFGNPYRSTKGRLGGGLGLFLVVSVVRKLGGTVTAQNRPGGGATVTLALPLAAIGLERKSANAA